MQYISSPNNELVKEVKKLKLKKYREEQKKFLAEGYRLVCEAVKAGVVETLFVEEGMPWNDDMNGDFTVIRAHSRVISALSDTQNPQGVIAVCRKTRYEYPDELSPGMWLVADNISDPGNLGTMLRTAWGVGANGVLLFGNCVDHFSSKTVRGSMGAVFFLPVIDADINDLRRWRQGGHAVVVADPQAERSYFETRYPINCLIVIGSEAHGVSPEIMEMADFKVKLPLYKGVDSINAAVCAGVMMYEYRRQHLEA